MNRQRFFHIPGDAPAGECGRGRNLDDNCPTHHGERDEPVRADQEVAGGQAEGRQTGGDVQGGVQTAARGQWQAAVHPTPRPAGGQPNRFPIRPGRPRRRVRIRDVGRATPLAVAHDSRTSPLDHTPAHDGAAGSTRRGFGHHPDADPGADPDVPRSGTGPHLGYERNRGRMEQFAAPAGCQLRQRQHLRRWVVWVRSREQLRHR